MTPKLSNNRRINVSEFKGKVLVNIREYYTDSAGESRPGKKVRGATVPDCGWCLLTRHAQGISLAMDQYNAFLKAIPEINAQLNEDGHKTADIPSASSAADPPSSSPSENKKQKAKPKKSNIEATSDEDEEDEEEEEGGDEAEEE